MYVTVVIVLFSATVLQDKQMLSASWVDPSACPETFAAVGSRTINSLQRAHKSQTEGKDKRLPKQSQSHCPFLSLCSAEPGGCWGWEAVLGLCTFYNPIVFESLLEDV